MEQLLLSPVSEVLTIKHDTEHARLSEAKLPWHPNVRYDRAKRHYSKPLLLW